MRERPSLTAVARVAVTSAACLLATHDGLAAQDAVSTLAPGIEHREIRRGDFATPGADRWAIHVLTLDPARARLALARALDDGVGVEAASSLAQRHGALAAVNGGYFRTAGTYRGEPVGAMVLGGRLLSEADRGRPALAIGTANGRTRAALVRVVVAAAAVPRGGPGRAIAGFNRPRGADELIAFTPDFHRTTLTGPDGTEVVLRRGRVESVRESAGSSPIPGDGLVLSGSGESGNWLRATLRKGMRCEVRTDVALEPPPGFVAEAVVGGGPVLLRGGQPEEPAAGESFAEEFRTRRHPRTAVGLRSDGTLMLVTVDGRQPERSVGMTLGELAALMKELGADGALNLDGGGSTTMVVAGRVVNGPSDAGGERPVSDALLVFPR